MSNLSKYQETAKRIIEVLNYDEFELNMDTYNSDGRILENTIVGEDTCGTSFCLAGWLAHKDDYPTEFFLYGRFDHDEYANSLLDGDSDFEWEFLFGPRWPNDKEAAIKRAQYVVDNGTHPPLSEWVDYVEKRERARGDIYEWLLKLPI